MSIWQAIVLGVLQGVTEFLPVSSSGHLVLVPWLLDWPAGDLAFDTVLHLGTMVAVLVYFRRDWMNLLRGGWKLLPGGNLDDAHGRVLVMLIIATVPAGIVGWLFEDFFEAIFAAPPVAAACLLVTAALLVLAEKLGNPRRALDDLIWTDVLYIGFAQALAMFPGISRSGSTIAAGLWRGVRRDESARFSFLLATPIILAAGTKQILKLAAEGAFITASGTMLAGFVAAAVMGYVCIWWLLNYLRRQRLYVFAVYCALFGVLCLFVAVARG